MSDARQDVETIREALRAAYERIDVVERGTWNLTGAIAALDRLAAASAPDSASTPKVLSGEASTVASGAAAEADLPLLARAWLGLDGEHEPHCEPDGAPDDRFTYCPLCKSAMEVLMSTERLTAEQADVQDIREAVRSLVHLAQSVSLTGCSQEERDILAHRSWLAIREADSLASELSALRAERDRLREALEQIANGHISPVFVACAALAATGPDGEP